MAEGATLALAARLPATRRPAAALAFAMRALLTGG